jgi:hypothetical protein
MAALACPACGSPFGASDVNLQTGLARCTRCNTAHQLAMEGAALPAVRPATTCPSTVTEDLSGVTLTLQARWYQPMAWFLLLFCIVWDGFLLTWYSMALFAVVGATVTGEAGPGGALAGVGMMLLFPLLHVAAGIGLTYTVATMFLNKTTLRVDPTELTVTHGPLYWPGALTLPTVAIDQLYVAERRGNRGSRTYRLFAIVEGTARQISTGHSDIDLVRYLEERIEKHLRIRDRRVAGEAM